MSVGKIEDCEGTGTHKERAIKDKEKPETAFFKRREKER